jgi:hypothetical protein
VREGEALREGLPEALRVGRGEKVGVAELARARERVPPPGAVREKEGVRVAMEVAVVECVGVRDWEADVEGEAVAEGLPPKALLGVGVGGAEAVVLGVGERVPAPAPREGVRGALALVVGDREEEAVGLRVGVKLPLPVPQAVPLLVGVRVRVPVPPVALGLPAGLREPPPPMPSAPVLADTVALPSQPGLGEGWLVSVGGMLEGVASAGVALALPEPPSAPPPHPSPPLGEAVGAWGVAVEAPAPPSWPLLLVARAESVGVGEVEAAGGVALRVGRGAEGVGVTVGVAGGV